MLRERPRVLCFSGHDPGGGAGLQADIETLAAHGVHGLSIVTALTVQDSRNVRRAVAVEPALMREQLDCLLADTTPAVIKIGLIGGVSQLPVIAEAIARCRVPVVCDPVLRAGGGRELAGDDLIVALSRDLLPSVTVLTPNTAEARRLAPAAASIDGAAAELLAIGCEHVLVTGGDEPGATVINTWHRPDWEATRFEWARLPETFHGAGCTLASAIAARLALGQDAGTALTGAQAWTASALAAAFAVGRGRRIPGRVLADVSA